MKNSLPVPRALQVVVREIFVHCTPPGDLKSLDEHASPQDLARRTANVETLERQGRLKLDTTRSKAKVS